MKKLAIDLDHLVMLALSRPEDVNKSYLDIETGKAVILPIDFDSLNVFDEEVTRDFPQWMKELVPAAQDILTDCKRHYPLRRISSLDIFMLMEKFIENIQNDKIRTAMSNALGVKRNFRRFHERFQDFPGLWEEWQYFQNEALRQKMRQGLRAELEIEVQEA